MEESHSQLRLQNPSLRRFVYRAANPCMRHSHPMRRRTDSDRLYQGMDSELCPQPMLIEWRVYLKLN